VQLVESCLMKDRDRRVQTAREVSDRLGTIARRLGGPLALGTAKRRATDRLPRDLARDTEGSSKTLFALGVEELKVLAKLRARRSTIGIASAITGIVIGALVAVLVGGQRGASDVGGAPAQAAALIPMSAAVPPAPAPLPPAAGPRGGSGSSGDPRDLALAVARGLGVGAKPRH